jgi:uncharacterized membrane protein YfcA
VLTWIGSLSAWYVFYALALIPLAFASLVALRRAGRLHRRAVLGSLAGGAGVFFFAAVTERDSNAGLKFLFLFLSVLASYSLVGQLRKQSLEP